MTSFTRLFISVLICSHPGKWQFGYPYDTDEVQNNCDSSIAWEVSGYAKNMTIPSSSQAL